MLANLGFVYVSYGETERGLKLMEQGVQNGALKYPEQTKLHLGLAYALAGHKSKAVQTLKTVQGGDGTADLARLWVLYAAKS